MSLNDFWLNVRTAARLIAPDAIADSPRLDPTEFERILKSAPDWITPKPVKGFDPKDFDFLPPEERDALTDSVNRFREIAQRVPRDKPATDPQIQEALPQFRRILDILRPDKYADPEALRIGKRVEQQLGDQLPPSVLELRFETGDDASGKPALWIWVVLKDEVLKDGTFSTTVRTVREVLKETVEDLGIDLWPYVRVRTDAELEALAKQSKR